MNRISASHDAVAVSVKILAICREEPQSKVCLWVLRLILKDPEMLTRQVADAAENSNGSAYYVPLALVEKGFIKLGNFKNNPRKGQYAYLLTPKGIRERSILTHSFIERKRQEFKDLKVEIQSLEEEVALVGEVIKAPRGRK